MTRRRLLQAAVLATLAACAGAPAPLRRSFLLRPDAPARAPAALPLAVALAPVQVAAPFQGRALVLRTGEARYEADPDNAFLAAPGPMLGDALRTWLLERGCFATVLPRGAPEDAQAELETALLDLHVDRRAGVRAQAVLRLRLRLTPLRPTLWAPLDLVLEAREAVAGPDAEAEVLALDRALGSVLLRFDAALAGLQGLPGR